MTRALGLISILLAMGACTAGSWLAIRPPLTPFLAQGAPDIQVVNRSTWEWQIRYYVPGPPYAWYGVVTHSLEEQQWNDRTLWRPDGSTMCDPVVPLRF